MARNPYDRRRRAERRPGMTADFADGGILPGFGGHRSTVEFEDLEAMVGQAAARGRREAAERAPERERQARRDAWDEGHAIGVSDGRMEIRGRFEERFSDEIRAAVTTSQGQLWNLKENGRSVTKAQLAERVARLVQLLVDVSAFRSDGEA